MDIYLNLFKTHLNHRAGRCKIKKSKLPATSISSGKVLVPCLLGESGGEVRNLQDSTSPREECDSKILRKKIIVILVIIRNNHNDHQPLHNVCCGTSQPQENFNGQFYLPSAGKYTSPSQLHILLHFADTFIIKGAVSCIRTCTPTLPYIQTFWQRINDHCKFRQFHPPSFFHSLILMFRAISRPSHLQRWSTHLKSQLFQSRMSQGLVVANACRMLQCYRFFLNLHASNTHLVASWTQDSPATCNKKCPGCNTNPKAIWGKVHSHNANITGYMHQISAWQKDHGSGEQVWEEGCPTRNNRKSGSKNSHFI